MRTFFVMMALLLIAGCGFRPMYGVNRETPVGVETAFEYIQLGNIPNREGQYLRNALIDRFYREGRPTNPQFVLNVEPLRESLIDLDITKDADATRGQLRLETTMSLTNKHTGAEVLSRTLRSVTSYNILGSEFASRITEENARENALDDLARQIEMQLGLYFKRGAPQPPPAPETKRLPVFQNNQNPLTAPF